MRSEYSSLQKQIERLQKKADIVRARDLKRVVDSITSEMAKYGITIEDLERAQTTTGRKTRKVAAAKTKSSVAPKYRQPETGDTWTGRGKPPRWLTAAEAAGTARDSFLIAPK